MQYRINGCHKFPVYSRLIRPANGYFVMNTKRLHIFRQHKAYEINMLASIQIKAGVPASRYRIRLPPAMLQITEERRNDRFKRADRSITERRVKIRKDENIQGKYYLILHSIYSMNIIQQYYILLYYAIYN